MFRFIQLATRIEGAKVKGEFSLMYQILFSGRFTFILKGVVGDYF